MGNAVRMMAITDANLHTGFRGTVHYVPVLDLVGPTAAGVQVSCEQITLTGFLS